MQLAVVGSAGSIGARRKRLLEEMGHKVQGFDVKDHTPFSASHAKNFDAVFVCTPPLDQTNTAYECAQREVPFFLEKPGAISFRSFLPLTSVCEKTGVVNMVACNLRFTAEFAAIKASMARIGKPLYATAEFGYYLPFWREGDYRTYYSSYRMAGGGILMDAIHELDYVAALFGDLNKAETTFRLESTDELDMEVEDSASLFITYKAGPAVAVHLDYLQRSYKRTFSLVGTKGRIDQTFNVQGSDSMYRDEMKHFLDCVKSKEPTIKDVFQHARLLEYLEKIEVNRREDK